MRAVCVLIVLVAAFVVLPSPGHAQNSDPAAAIFQLVIVEHTPDDHYKQSGYGSGFFIQPDGTALTASHVVYRAVHDPDHYGILAIVDKEFYSATVVCASKLPYDPTQPNVNGISASRDVAEIKLTPSMFPFSSWVYTFKTGEKLTIATAHQEDLPTFAALPLTGRPVEGQHVRVIGYGHISPLAEKWTASGHVSKTYHARDGTEIFDIDFTSRAQPGNSGSPVLDDEDRVVGLIPWDYLSQSNLGTGESASALSPACQ
jgi:V8-like Glu-specific endopeptidase